MSAYIVGLGIALYIIDWLVLFNISLSHIDIAGSNSSIGYGSWKETRVLLNYGVKLCCLTYSEVKSVKLLLLLLLESVHNHRSTNDGYDEEQPNKFTTLSSELPVTLELILSYCGYSVNLLIWTWSGLPKYALSKQIGLGPLTNFTCFRGAMQYNLLCSTSLPDFILLVVVRFTHC